ncbi:MAG: hypothetical protein V1729_02420 [Candidatus Woesearchaeota archaeon]
MKYRCTNCGYKFQPKTNRVPNSCPFCSSGFIQKNESAQDLIDSIGNKLIPEQ